MGLFRKRSTTVVDLTALQKSGTLQRARAIKNDNTSTTTNEFVDLTNQSTQSSSQSSTPDLDFLSDLAGASASTTETNSASQDNLNHIKIKMEDLEYKLQRLIERLERVEDKLLRED